MNRRKLFSRLTLLVVAIALINYGAIKFHWYYSLWWFDMPMHFLGGMWVAMLILWYLADNNFSVQSLVRVILGVLIIGVAWEVFEIVVNELIAKDIWDYKDSFSDLFFDLSGGFAAVFYAALRIMDIDKNKLEFYNAKKS